MSNARFMAKCLYILKAFIFQEELGLSPTEAENIKFLTIFITHIYTKYWLTCSSLIDAAANDMDFIDCCKTFKTINKPIAENVLRKMSTHTCYLSSENVGFSIFSDKIAVECKKKMVKRIKSLQSEWSQRENLPKLELKSLNLPMVCNGVTLCALAVACM